MSNEISIPIPARVRNVATGGHVCGAEDVDFGQKVVHLIKYDRGGNEVSFESQVTQANKIYVIHNDFILSSNVTIPANCVLQFDGGSVSGDGTNKNTIVFQNTALQGNPKLYDVIIEKSSTFYNSVIYADWFISDEERLSDCSSTLNMLIDYSCFLNSDVPLVLLGAKNYYIKSSLIITNYGHISHLYLNGVSNNRGHENVGTTIIVSESASNISTIVGANSNFESILNFKNISFDANNIADYSFNKLGISLSKIENCSFKHAKKICFFTENSYIVDIVNCSFEGVYGKTPANYGIFMGNGTCNAINIVGCTFESLRVGIYYGNGYNLNICGCTIEGIINCGIIVAYCNGLIIDGCYFEDVAEGRNIYESTVDNVANKVGVPIRAYIGNNNYTLVDDSKTTTSNSISIYTSILLGVGLFDKEISFFDNQFLKMMYYKNPNEEADAFGKANAVTIKGCTHSPFVKKGDLDYNTFGVMSFVTCMNVTGLNLESNNIYALDTANLNNTNVCYTLSTIVIEGHSSSRSVFARNNRNNSNVERVGHIFFHEPDSSITYILAASGKYKIAPETDETKLKINVQSNTYTPVEYYKGKGILQASGTRAYTVENPFTVQEGDSIIFEFYAKYQGGDANSMDIVINGKTFTFPLTIDFCRYNIIYTAESNFTFDGFTFGLNASGLRFSPDVDVWIQ